MNNLERERVLRRIKKCLALSASDNENEAAIALRQAKRLMDKYGIDMAEAAALDYEVHDLSTGKRSKSRLTHAEQSLYVVVASFFGCTLYFDNGWPVVVGTAPAPKVTGYAATVLLRQMRRGYDAIQQEMEDELGGRLSVSTKRRMRHSYNLAWASSVDDKVREFAAKVLPETRKAHDKAISKHWGMDVSETKILNVRGIDRNCAASEYAAWNGHKDGKKANLNMAMQNEYSPPAKIEHTHKIGYPDLAVVINA